MKIAPISSIAAPNVANHSKQNNSLSFKTGLQVERDVYNTIVDKVKFDNVMKRFKSWLEGQNPRYLDLVIAKNKSPKWVEQIEHNRIVERAENLAMTLNKGHSGFCFNECESDDTILADLKYTFECVRANAGL